MSEFILFLGYISRSAEDPLFVVGFIGALLFGLFGIRLWVALPIFVAAAVLRVIVVSENCTNLGLAPPDAVIFGAATFVPLF